MSESSRLPTDELTEAMRRVRLAAADRADRLADQRDEDLARLQRLLPTLETLVERAGPGSDLFDLGLARGASRRGVLGSPRLFLDALAFLDRRRGAYRLVRQSRHGRLVLGEAEDEVGAIRLVADYVAQRLYERELMLADDQTVEEAARRLMAARSFDQPAPARPAAAPLPVPAGRAAPEPAAQDAAKDAAALKVAPRLSRIGALAARLGRRGGPAPSARLAERSLAFTIQLLGSAALTLIVAMAIWWAWRAISRTP